MSITAEPTTATSTALELVPLCTMTGIVDLPSDLGITPSGRRLVFDVTSGRTEGERLSGTLRGLANGDWVTIGPEGTGTIDVRLILETDDGALILVQYLGRFDATVRGAPVYSTPRFETSDPRYQWLNRVQAVGKGFSDGTTMTYRVYQLR